MPVTDLMMEGVKLMFLGMGIVFSFLLLLVGAMTGMSRLARALEGDTTIKPIRSVSIPNSIPKKDVDQIDSSLVAAISASIKMYRDSRRQST